MTRSQTPFSLEYILLGFLFQTSIHGYELYKNIYNLKGISLIWNIKQSKLYTLLEKLEKDGLLASSIVPGEAYLMRKEFQITSLGRETFLTWVTSPVMHGRDMRQEFLAKLYFAQKSGIDNFMELIEKQRKVCSDWLSNLQENISKTTEEKSYERIIFQYRISQIKAMIEWLDHCRSEIQVINSVN
jgi:PadR family transcriptional regulator AphA